ncbi:MULTISPECIES: heme o synthase [Bacillaceae]|uniref:heme o synthase n=1 Tax=Bacillaceae TaxID=186817 RepID=UPI0009E18A17|nr:heme o synthase [Bacillus rubiinfantis]
MKSEVKIGQSIQKASLKIPKQESPKILAETIKIGIIKSNLIAMLAGSALALYTNHISPFEKLPEIIFAIIGSTLVIGAAGTFNNLYDRDIDSIMDRTKNRPTVTGVMPQKFGLIFGTSMALFGLAALAIAMPLASFFGLLGLFIYVVPYTMWSKRRTIFNTEIGSISGAMPPLIGWTAITSDMTHLGLLGLFTVMVLWQMPHFYSIAIRRHDEYKSAKVPMLPVVKGYKRTYIQTNIYLFALVAASFLFASVSIGITLVALLLSLGWFILSIVGYKKMPPEKWARMMFIFSLNHISILFITIVIYGFIGTFFRL